jgi:hypothetical protein
MECMHLAAQAPALHAQPPRRPRTCAAQGRAAEAVAGELHLQGNQPLHQQRLQRPRRRRRPAGHVGRAKRVGAGEGATAAEGDEGALLQARGGEGTPWESGCSEVAQAVSAASKGLKRARRAAGGKRGPSDAGRALWQRACAGARGTPPCRPCWSRGPRRRGPRATPAVGARERGRSELLQAAAPARPRCRRTATCAALAMAEARLPADGVRPHHRKTSVAPSRTRRAHLVLQRHQPQGIWEVLDKPLPALRRRQQERAGRHLPGRGRRQHLAAGAGSAAQKPSAPSLHLTADACCQPRAKVPAPPHCTPAHPARPPPWSALGRTPLRPAAA